MKKQPNNTLAGSSTVVAAIVDTVGTSISACYNMTYIKSTVKPM